jgi:hypothetical protein
LKGGDGYGGGGAGLHSGGGSLSCVGAMHAGWACTHKNKYPKRWLNIPEFPAVKCFLYGSVFGAFHE